MPDPGTMTVAHAPVPGEAAIRARWIVARCLGTIAAVIVFGMAGYLAAGWSAIDALYMVVVTISTVGYGETRPIDSTYLRVHTMLTIGMGVVAVGYSLAGILRVITEQEVSRLLGNPKLRRQIDALSDHTIVAGLGRMGMLVCEELASCGDPFVLIDLSPEKVAAQGERRWLFLVGDATEESVLLDAGLARAKALVTAIPSDAANVFITLTARQLNPGVKIIARAERASTQKKLKQAGASHVVLPAAIGAHRIVSILTNPMAVEFVELVTHRSSLAIEMDEVAVAAPGPFLGRSLRDLDVGRRTGVMVVAIKRTDGQVEFPPRGDEPLSDGDAIILLGRRDDLARFREEFRG